MQSVSINSTDILLKNIEREKLQSQIEAYLSVSEITVVDNRLEPLPEKVYAFSRIIATAPSRLSVVAADKEAIESMVRRFSKVKMTSYEIAKVLRERGYNLRSSSVKRVAQSIGVELRK